jgi:hypothetical protein
MPSVAEDLGGGGGCSCVRSSYPATGPPGKEKGEGHIRPAYQITTRSAWLGITPPDRRARKSGAEPYSSSDLPGLSAVDLASLEHVFKHVEKIFNPSEERI